MTIFEANIPLSVIDFFKINLIGVASFSEANNLLKGISGINDFFGNAEEFVEFKNRIEEYAPVFEEPNRRAYGDFQTHEGLANKVVKHLQTEGVSPEFVFEPTCGKGNFILASLKCFESIKKIVGVEIYYPYVWETKFKILALFLEGNTINKPEIEIIHEDVFNFNFEKLAKENMAFSSLVIGNPPWVTNSELGSLGSKNLPRKSNFKKHKGIDAITGKGNFDIGEYISLQLLKSFDRAKGEFAFLIKSSVVKNILYGQRESKCHIGNIRKLNINAKKEFNVSVDACLFLAKFDSTVEYTCQEGDFYSQYKITEFGWHKDKFVYSVADYDRAGNLDGKCPFVWRQGMKHDCSKIMELDRCNGHFINGFKQEVTPEKELLFGLLKSSDLKDEVISSYRKTTIVTQKKIGQDTSYIKRDYPITYDYLNSNREYFDRRKSSIYRGKPSFSIFGIGDYSFAKYKVAISGMYKRTTFSLVLPENDKPLMLDDTCYFIGFDNLKIAQVVQKILNSDIVQAFLKSIIFPDAKRSITKEVLMRIDLEKAFNIVQLETNNLKDSDWELLGDIFKEKMSKQIALF